MLTHKLEKDVLLYKNQFDMFAHQLFNGYIIDRTSLELDSLSFRIKYMIKNNKDLDKIDEKRYEFNNLALRLRSLFGELLNEFLYVIIQIPEYAHIEDIINVFAQDVEINTTYVKFKMVVISNNKKYLEYIDSKIDSSKPFNIYPDQYFRFTTDSYNDAIAKTYPELFDNKHQDVMGTGADGDVFCHSFTFQTSEDCNLCCTYCYQFAKTSERMSFETAKEFIDNLLADKYGYINRYNSPAIIIEFIGGEPFLEIDLTRRIYEYFLEKCYELNHPWFDLHRVSICSNGLLYFEPEVQSFFKDYSQNISFNISIDGNKELHDSCRIQPNGEGSYDIAIKALNHYNSTYSKERNSKMTLAPSNIKYLFDSVVDFIKNDMKVINLNCVFEEGWNQETAKEEFHQLVRLADYLIDNDLDHIYLSIFNDRQEDMQMKENDGNFCFVEGSPILTEDGYRPIEDVKISDNLYTTLGELNKCIYMHCDESNNNIIINTEDTFPIKCTHDHKFIIRRFTGEKISATGYLHKYDDEEILVSAEDIKPMDIIKVPLLNIPSKNKTWINKATAYMIGLYFGKGKIDIKNNTISFTIDEFQDEFENLQKIFKDAKLTLIKEEISSKSHKGSRNHNPIKFHKYTLRMTDSTFNIRFYKLCLSCGTDKKTQHLPGLLFRTSKEIIKEFFESYRNYGRFVYSDPYDGPTHGIIDYDGVEGVYDGYFESIYLANDIATILRCLDFNPTCIPVRIKDIKGWAYNVWFVEYEHSYLDWLYGGDGKYEEALSKRDSYWTTVESISHDKKLRKVYCPTVYSPEKKLDVHTIIVNGVGAKNCGGGSASMLSLRPNGEFYPCIRYMPTSIGNLPDVCIGNIHDGIIGRDEGSKIIKDLDENTRRAQNNDICYECPISNDCASCSALGYTVFGSLKKRTNFICIQMIAEALANVYYWNRLRLKHPEYNIPVRKNNVPTEWALLVVDPEELDELTLLQIVSHMLVYPD